MIEQGDPCPRCAAAIPADSRFCPACGNSLAPRSNKLQIILVVAAVSLALAYCVKVFNDETREAERALTSIPKISADAKEALAVAKDRAGVAPEAGMQSDAPESNWNYVSRTDELRGKTIRNAMIISENSANFDFPYAGSNHLHMHIRSHPQYGTDLILQIEKGQILCHSYSDPCKGMISIDGKVEALTFGESDDNDSTVAFAVYPKPLIAKIKGSKRVIIELPFFQEGNVQFMFNTEGLEWPPKS